MQHNNLGILYLDVEKNVLKHNSRAKQILRTQSNVSLISNKLRFVDDNAKLSFDLKVEASDLAAKPGHFFLQGDSPNFPLKLSIYPILDRESRIGNVEVSSLVLLDLKDGKSQLSSESMAQHYELTSAEKSLVSALHYGDTLANYAKKRGVKLTTVRWTLDNVFSKTFTHSQMELRDICGKYVL